MDLTVIEKEVEKLINDKSEIEKRIELLDKEKSNLVKSVVAIDGAIQASRYYLSKYSENKEETTEESSE